MSDTMELTTPSANPLAPIDEMATAQSAIIAWCKSKIQECHAEHLECSEAFEYAVKQKWANGALKRAKERAEKRLNFYNKVLGALEAGYVIIPNFPVTAFAIRTDKNRPLKMLTTSWSQKHTQQPPALPAGEGEYKNPFPEVHELSIKPPTQTTSEVKKYWAESWKDLEFPITMAKPTIMEAVTRTMALKIFDDIGVLPGFAPGEGTRPPKGDPIIVARILDPTRSWRGYSESVHWVTFMVAWHLNVKDI